MKAFFDVIAQIFLIFACLFASAAVASIVPEEMPIKIGVFIIALLVSTAAVKYLGEFR